MNLGTFLQVPWAIVGGHMVCIWKENMLIEETV